MTKRQTFYHSTNWLSLLAGGCLFFLFSSSTLTANDPVEISVFWQTRFFDSAVRSSGLDVRDASNRPIRASAALDSLKQLFLGTVFHSLLTRDLPLVARTRQVLEEGLTPFRERITRALQKIFHALEIGFILNLKRFTDLLGRDLVRLIHSLSALFIVCAFFLPVKANHPAVN